MLSESLELQEWKDLLANIPNARDALVWREVFSEKAGDVPDFRSQTITASFTKRFS
jgi:hypothetical protein